METDDGIEIVERTIGGELVAVVIMTIDNQQHELIFDLDGIEGLASDARRVAHQIVSERATWCYTNGIGLSHLVRKAERAAGKTACGRRVDMLFLSPLRYEPDGGFFCKRCVAIYQKAQQ